MMKGEVKIVKLQKDPKFLYPEHEKLHRIKHLSQPLGEFLEWLDLNDYEICENVSRRGVSFEPCHKNVQQWLAEFYDIDLVKIDEEKEQMLAELRKEVEAE